MWAIQSVCEVFRFNFKIEQNCRMLLLGVCWLMVINVILTNAENGGVLTDAMEKGIVKLGEKCMKTVDANIDEMNALRNGPPYQGKTACVMACILDKAGVMEKKKFSKQGLVHAAFPFIFTDPKKLKRFQEIAGVCDTEIKATVEDECEAANHIVMCLRKNIPQLAEIKF